MIRFLRGLLIPALLFSFLLVFAACEDTVSTDPPGNGTDDPEFRMVSYDLGAVTNDGTISDGASATATFRELRGDSTLITLELDGGSTETGLIHVSHIHENTAEEGGDIVHFLSPVDGLEGSPGESHTISDWSFDELVDYDGYINIHENNANLGIVFSQGNIGANADAEVVESDWTPVEEPMTASYQLEATSNDGMILPNGVEGWAHFIELTSSETLVTLEVEQDALNSNVSHPSHIHNNSVDEGGGIEIFLSPIDGLDGSPGTSAMVIDEDIQTMLSFDGYINIHETNENLGDIISQGNIGANADSNGDNSN